MQGYFCTFCHTSASLPHLPAAPRSAPAQRPAPPASPAQNAAQMAPTPQETAPEGQQRERRTETRPEGRERPQRPHRWHSSPRQSPEQTAPHSGNAWTTAQPRRTQRPEEQPSTHASRGGQRRTGTGKGREGRGEEGANEKQH